MGKVKNSSGERYVYEMTKADIDAALGKTTLDVEDLFKSIEEEYRRHVDTKDGRVICPGYNGPNSLADWLKVCSVSLGRVDRVRRV